MKPKRCSKHGSVSGGSVVLRSANARRATRETDVRVAVDLDGVGATSIATGSPMLDHMLEAFALHASLALDVHATSLDAIQHHLVEDVAIVLGKTLAQALGDRAGIARYGEALIPMDDALVRCAVDAGGRAYTRVALNLRVERIEDLSAELVTHFFQSLAINAGLTLHVDALAGDDGHHVVEAAFKAVARACRSAFVCDVDARVLSTKGLL